MLLLLLLLMMMTTMMMMIRGLQCSERTALAAGRNAPGCSTNSLQPITLHLHCTAVERRQVRAAVQCSAVCFLTAVLLDPTRPDGFFSAAAADAPLSPAACTAADAIAV